VIDSEGYRLNVGIIICNTEKQVLWARRIGQDAWQFPQGGICQDESPEDALYRELKEEIGLLPEHVELVDQIDRWLHYKLPRHMIRHGQKPLCIGQKQRWFLLKLVAHEDAIKLADSEKPEFDDWQWVDFWHPLSEVVPFKRKVYETALTEFEATVIALASQGNQALPR